MRNRSFWDRHGDTFTGALMILAVLLAGYGWCANIFKIAAVISDPLNGMFVLRVIGVFMAPLGAILGFC